MAAAGPGEILVTAAVSLAAFGTDRRFDPAGDHTLKGVAGTWPLFRDTTTPPRHRPEPEHRHHGPELHLLDGGCEAAETTFRWVVMVLLARLLADQRCATRVEGELLVGQAC